MAVLAHHGCAVDPSPLPCVFVKAELLAGKGHSSAASEGTSLPPAGPAAAELAASAGGAGAVLSGLSWLDRLLPVWIVGAMVIGVLLGSLAPQVGPSASNLGICSSCNHN
jgi:hypothetical protein